MLAILWFAGVVTIGLCLLAMGGLALLRVSRERKVLYRDRLRRREAARVNGTERPEVRRYGIGK